MPITIIKKESDLYEVKIENYNEEEFNNFMQEYLGLYKNLNAKIYMIFNALDLTVLRPSQIIKLTSFLNVMKPVHRDKLEKFVMIVTNKSIQNILDGVFTVIPPVRPYIITTKYSEAESYIGFVRRFDGRVNAPKN